MKTKNEVMLTDRINSNSGHVNVLGMRLVLPGNSKVEFSEGAMNILIEKRETRAKKDILQALEEGIERSRPDSVLVSGGIDSSILAAIAARKSKNVKLVTAGTADSEDMHYADLLAKDLGKGLYTAIINEESVYNAVRGLKSLDIDMYSIIMGITEFLAMEKAKESGCRRIISGIGSDELFFGFYRHKKMQKDLLKSFREERLFYMPAFDLWRLNSMASKMRVSVSFPYLEDDLIDIVMSKDINEIAEGYDKALLRSIGKKIGLNEAIIERKKKAMQYGSGTVKMLRRLSGKKGYKNVGEFIKGI